MFTKSEEKRIPCAKCASTNTVKDGNKNGKQNYLCKVCGRQFTNDYTIVEYEKRVAVTLYCFGLSLRKIADTMHYSHVTILNWVKTYADKCKNAKDNVLLDLEDVQNFLSSRKTWLGMKKKIVNEEQIVIEVQEQLDQAINNLTI